MSDLFCPDCGHEWDDHLTTSTYENEPVGYCTASVNGCACTAIETRGGV